LTLWKNDQEECDRVYIALYRLQTEGRVAYRRLVGMHGGGGGTSDANHLAYLTAKMEADKLQGHYHDGFPLDTVWPGAVPNAAYPETITSIGTNEAFAYTFCWHGSAPFIVWHRPLMAEFERNLQVYDPKFKDETDTTNQHEGPEALGAPYWGWEGWDGITLPIEVSTPMYTVKTNAWADKGYPQGSAFPNPFHRWFAPVSVEDQMNEVFPDLLNDANCTTRAGAFYDQNQQHEFDWPTDMSDANSNTPSMYENVMNAIANPVFMEFATKGSTQSDDETTAWGEGGGNTSIENPHNLFHNRVGGTPFGGLQGRGNQFFFFDGVTTPERIQKAQEDDLDGVDYMQYYGTMTSNQSIFDPIFWLHHGNIERQLMSWQALHTEGDDGVVMPNDALRATVIYPWTKPAQLYAGNESWNSPCDDTYNATFGDWFDTSVLRYEYDALIQPDVSANVTTASSATAFGFGGLPMLKAIIKGAVEAEPIRIMVEIERKHYRTGDFRLFCNGKLVGSDSVFSAQGTPCGRCRSGKSTRTLHYCVLDGVGSLDDVLSTISGGGFTLKRNRINVPYVAVKARAWHEGVSIFGKKPRKRSRK